MPLLSTPPPLSLSHYNTNMKMPLNWNSVQQYVNFMLHSRSSFYVTIKQELAHNTTIPDISIYTDTDQDTEAYTHYIKC